MKKFNDMLRPSQKAAIFNGRGEEMVTAIDLPDYPTAWVSKDADILFVSVFDTKANDGTGFKGFDDYDEQELRPMFEEMTAKSLVALPDEQSNLKIRHRVISVYMMTEHRAFIRYMTMN